MAINEVDLAYKHLEQYYEFSKNSKEQVPNAQTNAAMQLGHFYWKKNNYNEAIKYLKIYFDCAKNQKIDKDRRVIDNARISIGLAKSMNSYNEFINTILESKRKIIDIINFKNKND